MKLNVSTNISDVSCAQFIKPAKSFENKYLENVTQSDLHIKYQLEYFSEKNTLVKIITVDINEGDLLLSRNILCIRSYEDILLLDAVGYEIGPPSLYSKDFNLKLYKLIASLYIEEIKKIINAGYAQKCSLACDIYSIPQSQLQRVWFDLISEYAISRDIKFFTVVNLDSEISSIYNNFRKSYKSLVKHEKFGINVETLDYQNIKKSDMMDFRNLHALESGRITRGQKTWDIQLEMIMSSAGFLVVLSEEMTGKKLSYSFFEYSKNDCMYSSAVYDRNRRELPLGHIALFNAIKKSKALGCKIFRVGEYLMASDSVTVKELNISKFKRGFSDEIGSQIIFMIKNDSSYAQKQ